MKHLFLPLMGILLLVGCSQNPKNYGTKKQNSTLKSTYLVQPASQYVIEANTMILHDTSIDDPIASRRFFRCDDVFSLQVYAKLHLQSGAVQSFRVVSIIYDEKKVLDINLDDGGDPSVPTPIESYLLGYSIENGYGSTLLQAIKPSDYSKIEIYVKEIKTSIPALTDMAYDARNVMADQIVIKKVNPLNSSTIPFKRMNVFSDNIFIKHPMDDTKLKVIDFYRPAEIYYDFRINKPVMNIKFFATATTVDSEGKNANGNLYHVPNPRIIEK